DPSQLSQDLAIASPAAASTQLFVTNDQGLVLASTSPGTVNEWVQSKLEPAVQTQLNVFYSTGNAGSALVEGKDLSLLAEQPLDVTPLIRWHVVTIRPGLSE